MERAGATGAVAWWGRSLTGGKAPTDNSAIGRRRADMGECLDYLGRDCWAERTAGDTQAAETISPHLAEPTWRKPLWTQGAQAKAITDIRHDPDPQPTSLYSTAQDRTTEDAAPRDQETTSTFFYHNTSKNRPMSNHRANTNPPPVHHHRDYNESHHALTRPDRLARKNHRKAMQSHFPSSGQQPKTSPFQTNRPSVPACLGREGVGGDGQAGGSGSNTVSL